MAVTDVGISVSIQASQNNVKQNVLDILTLPLALTVQ